MTSSRVIVHLDNLILHRLQRRYRIGIMGVDGDQDNNNITSNRGLKSSGAQIINHIQEPETYRGHHQFKGPPTI